MSKFFQTITTNLLIFLICHQLLTVNAAKTRIVGGETTTINKVKYIVSLRQPNGQFFCGGSLVKKQYVVTAAHCVKGLKASDLNVHAGVTFLNQKGLKRSVSKIIMPEAFNLQNVTMDVAVLKLSKPMRGKNIATIPLCSHPIVINDWVKVSGWGFTSEVGYGPSEQLRTVNVRLISKKTCKSDYRGLAKLSNTMMCASIPGKKDACSGDSGGPLIHRFQLCGIVSFGVGCARKQYPGVYTNVNQVKKFINYALKK